MHQLGDGMTKANVDKLEPSAAAPAAKPLRPRDAATLILLDRKGDDVVVLMGRRHAGHAFMPGKFVFPGGRTDPADSRVAVATALPPKEEANLTAGIGRTSVARARAIALSAIRETYEEAGLLIGRKGAFTTTRRDWQGFAEHGVVPSLEALRFIARAITPPNRERRFDTRFFTADASAITHQVEGVIHADAELVELVWVEIGSKPLADLHPMTRNVLGVLEKRLATGPLRHDAAVPFFHFYGGKMQKDVLGEAS